VRLRLGPAEAQRIERLSERLTAVNKALGARADAMQEDIGRAVALTHEFVKMNADLDKEKSSVEQMRQRSATHLKSVGDLHERIVSRQRSLYDLQRDTHKIQSMLFKLLDPNASFEEAELALEGEAPSASSEESGSGSEESGSEESGSGSEESGSGSEESSGGSEAAAESSSASSAPALLSAGYYKAAGTTHSARTDKVTISPRILLHLKENGELEGSAFYSTGRYDPVLVALRGQWTPAGLKYEEDFHGRHFVFQGTATSAHTIDGAYKFGHAGQGSFHYVHERITEERYREELARTGQKPMSGAGMPCSSATRCPEGFYCAADSRCSAHASCTADADCSNPSNQWVHVQCLGEAACNLLTGMCSFHCDIEGAVAESRARHGESSSNDDEESGESSDPNSAEALRKELRRVASSPHEEVAVGRVLVPGYYVVRGGWVQNAETGTNRLAPGMMFVLREGGVLAGVVEHLAVSDPSRSVVLSLRGEWESSSVQFHEFFQGRLYTFTAVLQSGGLLRGTFTSQEEGVGKENTVSPPSKFEWNLFRFEVRGAESSSDEGSEDSGDGQIVFESSDCAGPCPHVKEKVEFRAPEIKETTVAPELFNDIGDIDDELSSSEKLRFRTQAIHDALQRQRSVEDMLLAAQSDVDSVEAITTRYIPKQRDVGEKVLREIEENELRELERERRTA
jgi:hypothetical protein